MKLYSYEGHGGVKYCTKRIVTMTRARAYSNEVSSVVEVYEHILEKATPLRMICAAANHEFLITSRLAGFRRGVSIKGWAEK